MDTSFTIKPRDTAVRRVTGRSNVVRTDLAPIAQRQCRTAIVHLRSRRA